MTVESILVTAGRPEFYPELLAWLGLPAPNVMAPIEAAQGEPEPVWPEDVVM